jgi:protein required for attachment to host cells
MMHILVADARTVRVFQSSAPPRSFSELAVFRNSAAGRHERDLVSDRPGRVINGAAGRRQTYEPRTRARQHSTRMWFKQIGPSIRELLASQNTEGVLLVAAPRVLVELRKCLPSPIGWRILGELPVDVVRQTLATLRVRLQPALRDATRRTLSAEPVYRAVRFDRSPARVSR